MASRKFEFYWLNQLGSRIEMSDRERMRERDREVEEYREIKVIEKKVGPEERERKGDIEKEKERV